MKDDIKTILKESTKDILSEDNLQKIVEAYDQAVESGVQDKISLAVEAATTKQDLENFESLKTLLEDIDNDHTKKLEQVVEALEKKHTAQLKTIIKKYHNDFVTESKKFKDDLVSKLDRFFTISVEQAVPAAQINEAVENTYYKKAFEQIKKLVGISEVSTNELVKTGILEAKESLDAKDSEIKTLTEKVSKLEKDAQKYRVEKLLKEKTTGLPKEKREYIQRVLGTKSEKFITENFDYTVKMYDQDENKKLESITESAKVNSKVLKNKVDRPESTIVESIEDSDIDPYIAELSKY
jgi:uncharacterized coiled-coil protein SlyX